VRQPEGKGCPSTGPLGSGPGLDSSLGIVDRTHLCTKKKKYLY